MAEFRGKLYVFVDKLEETESSGTTPKKEAGDIFALRAPGEMLWYQTGWAVGRNERGAYCARTSASKMLCFETFASAKDFVRKKRKARPQDNFYLVYEVDGHKSIVTSLEKIQRLDCPQGSALPVVVAGVGAEEMSALITKVGKIVAGNAVVLLKLFNEEGEAAARARFSGATYDRLWHVLLDAALVKE